MESPNAGQMALIGKSVVIKGELSGSEDLFLDGRVQGTVELHGHNLTIGPNGQVQANINAKGVFVQGRLEGDVQASDRVELRSTAMMLGDIVTQRIAIEDGAFLKGKVELQKQASKFEVAPEPKWAPASPAAPAPPLAAVAVTAGSGSTTVGVHSAKPEQKK